MFTLFAIYSVLSHLLVMSTHEQKIILKRLFKLNYVKRFRSQS